MKFLLDHDVPDDLAYSLATLGHQVVYLRDVLPITAEDEAALRHAAAHDQILITCNRDDFLELAGNVSHVGIIILFRRKTRTAERVALVRLLDRADESGLRGNINFA